MHYSLRNAQELSGLYACTFIALEDSHLFAGPAREGSQHVSCVSSFEARPFPCWRSYYKDSLNIIALTRALAPEVSEAVTLRVRVMVSM